MAASLRGCALLAAPARLLPLTRMLSALTQTWHLQGQALTAVGLALIVCGEAVRKTAMVSVRCAPAQGLHLAQPARYRRAQPLLPPPPQVTAGSNFTHALQFQRRDMHVLITHGIYRCERSLGCLNRGQMNSTAFCPAQRLAQRRAARCRYVRHPGYLGWLLWVTGTQALLCNPLCLLAFPVVVRAPSQIHTSYTHSMESRSVFREGKRFLRKALQVEPSCTAD